MINAAKWMAGAFAVLTSVALSGGCGDSHPSGVGEDGTNRVTQANGRCSQEGQVSACAIEIGRSGDVVSCAKGTRVCRGGAWGPCAAETGSSTSVYTVAAPPTIVGAPSGTGALRGLSISPTSSDCTDNPCDQYCKNFPDVPDAALTGDSAVTYPDKNLTFNDLPNGNPPDGFIKKGNDNAGVCGTCYPGASLPYSATQTCQEACQFDSYCIGNGANGCQMFSDNQKNACSGIDITTPLICQIPAGAPSNVGKRKLAVCNRGDTAVPANSNIACWKFPGGQPQYPNSDPLSSATNSAGLVDTFNEKIDPGQCITHIVDDSVFGNSGTTSVMCNVRQLYTSVVWLPGQGPLPTQGNLPSTTPSAGGWTNVTNAYTVDGVSATTSLASTPESRGPTTFATSGGWYNTGNIGSAADNANAQVEIGSGRATLTNAASSLTVPNASNPAWTNQANGRVIDGAAASVVVKNDTATLSNLPWTDAAADVGTWSNPTNADGAPTAPAVAASVSIPKKSGGINGTASLWGAVGGLSAIPSGARISGARVRVYWHTSSANVVGRVELYGEQGATLLAARTNIAVPTTTAAGGAYNVSTDFTFTRAELAGLTLSDASLLKFVKIVGENSDNNAQTLDIDAVSVDVDYVNPANVGVLRYTNFGFNLDPAATISSVVITARVASTASVAADQTTFSVIARKSGQAKRAAATLVTRTGSSTLGSANDIVFTVPVGSLTAADLSDTNFAVDVAATSNSAAGDTLLFDGVTVAVTYTAPNTASTLTLAGFGLGGIVPATYAVESIKTEVGFGISAANSKATLTATTKVNGTSLGAAVSVTGPATAITNYSQTYSPAGLTAADMANLTVDLGGATTGTGFEGLVDYVKVTVTYTAGLSSTIALSGYGFAVPVGSTDISANVQAKWACTDSNTQLCFQVYDTSTNADIGTAHCSTAGATPSTLSVLESDGFAITQVNATNLGVKVTATRSAGSPASTCSLDYVAVQEKYTTPPQLTGVDECNVNNNWTVSKKNPPLYCPAVTTYFDFYTTRVFDGVCPAGTRTRWRLFGWDSADPNSTKIEFRFRSFAPTTMPDGSLSCQAVAPAYSDPPVPLATAQSTPTDTQVCSLTAPPANGCPADLTTYLGNSPNSDLRCLQMDAHGYADSQGAPTLNGWTATYDCLPTE